MNLSKNKVIITNFDIKKMVGEIGVIDDEFRARDHTAYKIKFTRNLGRNLPYDWIICKEENFKRLKPLYTEDIKVENFNPGKDNDNISIYLEKSNAIRIIYIPENIIVESIDGASQFKNYKKCINKLEKILNR